MSTDSYKNPKWQQARLRIMERDGWKCVACGDAESTLHVHHFYYDGQPWEVADEFLQTLCEDCHADLGQHPKGGLYWTPSKDGSHIVAVCWCPQCSGMKFKDKGTYFKCIACGWNTTDVQAAGIVFGPKIELLEPEKKEKSKEYSLHWLKGMMTKIRNGGATDLQIFEAIWPDSPAIKYVEQLEAVAKQLSQALKNGDLTEDQELHGVEFLVRVRRKIQLLLADEFDRGHLSLKQEATDGTQAR